MVLLVDEPLRGDISSPIREAQAAGEQRAAREGAWRGRGGPRVPSGCAPSVGLQVMALGLAGGGGQA